MRVLSLGAGVQSSAMLLMALEGRFGDKPDCAIFADTQWEPAAVYEWLDRLEREVAPFPIHRVTAGNIRTDAEAGAVPSMGGKQRRFASLPFFLNTGISWGMGRRQCSKEYKVTPIRRHLRAMGLTSAEVWIGISTDEAHRMKPADVKWITHRWPLIEQNTSRLNCGVYLLNRMGSIAPKSSCIGCPFHDDAYWLKMRTEAPEEFAQAVAFDHAIRRTGRMNADQFVHRSCQPLGDIKEFRHEKQGRMFLDGFGNECEGICGT